jgi:hypothetical protein
MLFIEGDLRQLGLFNEEDLYDAELPKDRLYGKFKEFLMALIAVGIAGLACMARSCWLSVNTKGKSSCSSGKTWPHLSRQRRSTMKAIKCQKFLL